MKWTNLKFLFHLVLAFAALGLSVYPASLAAQVVQLEGTTLSVSLPAEWELAPAKVYGISPKVIRYKSEPHFEISVKQSSGNNPFATVVTSLPFECDVMFGVLQGANNGKTGTLLPRPDYIPQDYYARVLAALPVEKRSAIFACLYLGSSNITVSVQPAPAPNDGAKLTPLLQSIADSGRRNSALIYGPGILPLQKLNVSVTISSGAWGAGKITMGAVGEVDQILRTGGAAELKIMPVILDGVCSVVLKNGLQRKSPPYLSSKWEPVALEQLRENDPTNRLSLTVCRPMKQAKILLVIIMYGADQVPSNDAPLIAKALDEIADAVIKNQK